MGSPQTSDGSPSGVRHRPGTPPPAIPDTTVVGPVVASPNNNPRHARQGPSHQLHRNILTDTPQRALINYRNQGGYHVVLDSSALLVLCLLDVPGRWPRGGPRSGRRDWPRRSGLDGRLGFPPVGLEFLIWVAGGTGPPLSFGLPIHRLVTHCNTT